MPSSSHPSIHTNAAHPQWAAAAAGSRMDNEKKREKKSRSSTASAKWELNQALDHAINSRTRWAWGL